MTTSYDIATLIEALKRLYSRIASLALQKRLGSRQQDNGVGIERDIAAPLNETIDRLGTAKEMNGQGLAPDASSNGDPVTHRTSPRHRRQAGRPPPKTGRVFKELSRFLGRKETGSALQPHVSQKLQASVWEHIHTSLRLARQGDAETARLHADVANNALKETARHMSRGEYGVFCAQVNRKLGEIRNLVKTPPPAE